MASYEFSLTLLQFLREIIRPGLCICTYRVHIQMQIVLFWLVIIAFKALTGSLLGGIATNPSSLARSIVTVPSWGCGFFHDIAI